jgi:dTDP-4-amino-4,6-dideoxygalactose transaminase
MQILQAPRASAVLYSLLANLKHKNDWLLPANICPIVPITFLKARVPFKFVDISAQTLHLDLDQAESLIRTRRFGGLLYAHTYGDASTPNDFFASIKTYAPEILIIDDRCLCVPDLEPDPSNQADVQLYSTGYAKIVELNFGGYAFAHDDLLYQAVHSPFNPQHLEAIEKSYKWAIGQRTKFIYQDSDWLETETPVFPWVEYRQQIERNLPESLNRRSLLNQVYARLLPAEIQLPSRFQTWRFNIRVKNKPHILEAIFSAGLFASSHYASLAGIMDEVTAPQAETLAECIINLFNDHHFSLEQAEQVCEIILENLP